MEDKLLKLSDIAEYLQVTRNTVYRWANTGYLPTITIGKMRRVKSNVFNEWLGEVKKPVVTPTQEWPTLRYDDEEYKVDAPPPEEPRTTSPDPNIPIKSNNEMVREGTPKEYSAGIASRLQYLKSPFIPEED